MSASSLLGFDRAFGRNADAACGDDEFAVLVAMLFPLLIWLSLALTMLFTGMPFAIVHLLLRWLGHH